MVTENISRLLSKEDSWPRISADQIRLCIRRALECGCEWVVETAPHASGWQTAIGLMAQSSIDDLKRGYVILVAGRGGVYIPQDEEVPPAVALDAALTGDCRPSVFLLDVEHKNGEWKLYFDRDEEVI